MVKINFSNAEMFLGISYHIYSRQMLSQFFTNRIRILTYANKISKQSFGGTKLVNGFEKSKHLVN